jgi:uncharacterized protein (TIGR03435 family)
MQKLMHSGQFALFSCALFGQALLAQPSPTAPRFDFADIHTSAKTRNETLQTGPVRDGRYEIRTATMLDLIRIAWNFDADRILGGPDWLEQDKFDVIAKVPLDSTAEDQRLMLQSLLKDRFKLVLQESTEPVPTWALASEKKTSIKEADGSGETGCKQQIENPQAGLPPQPGDPPRTAADLLVHYSCRNIAMADFAGGLRSMLGIQLRVPVIDQTGLQGKWNFDVKWSVPATGMSATNQISPADALEKQLGLKLEQVPIPKSVLTVASVERMPSPNPPGTKEALPDIAIPREFEVADVKLLDSNGPKPRRSGMQMQPGGRFVAEGVQMGVLLTRAFDTTDSDPIANIPSWADSVQVTITAKVPPEYPAGQSIDRDIIGHMLRAVLVERFGLAWHTEQRVVSAYSLVATKPKLKKASPNSRIFCRTGLPPPTMAQNAQVLTCQNATMAFLAEQLQKISGISAPVEDATGIEGGWDFTFSYSGFRPAARSVAGDASSADRNFELIENQLGLKLKAEKRMLPATVIDRLNQKPTGN